MAPTFFDTNILVYATLDQDVVKKRVAATLIAHNGIAGARSRARCEAVSPRAVRGDLLERA